MQTFWNEHFSKVYPKKVNIVGKSRVTAKNIHYQFLLLSELLPSSPDVVPLCFPLRRCSQHSCVRCLQFLLAAHYSWVMEPLKVSTGRGIAQMYIHRYLSLASYS